MMLRLYSNRMSDALEGCVVEVENFCSGWLKFRKVQEALG
jgi:hypothetical protein